MTLSRGRLIGYEFDRIVMLFSMVDGQREIPCAISTSAMDHLESPARSQPNQREAQFIRLRDERGLRIATFDEPGARPQGTRRKGETPVR
jgi:hypothetical protein